MAEPVSPLGGAPLSPPAQAEASPQLKQLAQQFESMFLTEMMGPMFEGLDTDGLGGGGMGEEMFRPMLIEQYAHAISNQGGIGLADALVRELARLQTAQAALADPNETEEPHGARG